MEFIKIDLYIKHFDELIRQERTGTSEEFAAKLGISRRTLQRHIEQLREIGIDIVYDSYRQTYKYAQRGQIVFKFHPEDLKDIKG